MKDVNFVIVKAFDKETYAKFHKGICPKCQMKELIDNGKTNEGWTYKHKCKNCNSCYEYTPSDMGQSMPILQEVYPTETTKPDHS